MFSLSREHFEDDEIHFIPFRIHYSQISIINVNNYWVTIYTRNCKIKQILSLPLFSIIIKLIAFLWSEKESLKFSLHQNQWKCERLLLLHKHTHHYSTTYKRKMDYCSSLVVNYRCKLSVNWEHGFQNCEMEQVFHFSIKFNHGINTTLLLAFSKFSTH